MPIGLRARVLSVLFLAPLVASLQIPAFADDPPAVAAAGITSLQDVPTSSWAYAALQQLVDDGIVTGYPDGTFKGERPLTRYEMAVVVERAIEAMQTRYEQRKSTPDADVDSLRKLAALLQDEIKTIEAHVAALDTRVGKVEQQTVALQKTTGDNQKRTDTLSTNAARAHLDVWFWNRPGVFNQNVVAVNGPIANAAAPANGILAPGFGAAPAGNAALGSLSSGPGPSRPNTLVTGNTNRVFDVNDIRVLFGGTLDKNFSYATRLENIYQTNGPNGVSTSTPALCTNVFPPPGGCGVQDYTQYAESIRLNYAYLKYASPGGVTAKIGRLIQDEGAYNGNYWATGGNQVNGIQVGYATKRFNAYTMGIIGNSALTNAGTAPACPLDLQNCSGNSTIAFLGKADYFFPSSQTDIGFTYDDYTGVQTQVWNPAAGLCANGATTTRVLPIGVKGACAAYISAPQNGSPVASPVTGAYQTITTNIIGPSIFVSQFFGNRALPQFRVSAEYLWRVGLNPLTGSPWEGNRSLALALTYASKGNLYYGGPVYGSGAKGSNVVDFEYYNEGLNSSTVDGGNPAAVINYQPFFYNNQQGYQNIMATVAHWITNDVKVGLVYNWFGNTSGIFIPMGSNSCPGCYIKSVNANALNLDVMLIF